MPQLLEPVREISFNPVMLAAAKAGRKTVTRRRISQHAGLLAAPGQYLFCGMQGAWGVFEERQPGLAPQEVRLDCPFGMPGTSLRVKEEAGLVLEVVQVRAEQVQAITEADALAEGVVEYAPISRNEPSSGQPFCLSETDGDSLPQQTAVEAFRALLDTIYPTAWARNQWVWVVEFRLIPPHRAG